MWDFRCPHLAGWAGPLLPEQPNCQGNQTAPTQDVVLYKNAVLQHMIILYSSVVIIDDAQLYI